MTDPSTLSVSPQQLSAWLGSTVVAPGHREPGGTAGTPARASSWSGRRTSACSLHTSASSDTVPVRNGATPLAGGVPSGARRRDLRLRHSHRTLSFLTAMEESQQSQNCVGRSVGLNSRRGLAMMRESTRSRGMLFLVLRGAADAFADAAEGGDASLASKNTRHPCNTGAGFGNEEAVEVAGMDDAPPKGHDPWSRERRSALIAAPARSQPRHTAEGRHEAPERRRDRALAREGAVRAELRRLAREEMQRMDGADARLLLAYDLFNETTGR